MQLTDLPGWVDSEKAAIESTLRQLVEINTFTANHAGVDEGMDILSQIAQDMGFRVETIQARHRLIRVGKQNGHKPRVLLISHMDTVFPPDGDFLHYEPLGDGFVQGPGVGDIKGGMLIGLWAMKAISEMLDDICVEMIVSADEEKGSATIRDWYLAGHTGADYAIGLEPGFPQGELTPTVDLGVVYQRRGYCAIRFTVYGKDSHSGTPEKGLSAMEAMAQRIVKIHALNDPERGITTNVGTIAGGISPNTVPGSVEATVSFRYLTMSDGEETKEKVEEIIKTPCVYNPDLDLWDHTEYTVEAYLPPMERSESNQYLIDKVMEQVERLGQNVVPIARGGGSDANYISASGTPSICGMGAPAQGIHTQQEKIYLPGLYDRVTLLASTLYSILSESKEA